MPGHQETEHPAPNPEVSRKAKRELGIGTFAGLLFAEAISSVRLFGLGERVGLAWYLAWLLPGALDIYAVTMVRFFSQLPGNHRLRHKASREAIIALLITVGCNGLYETILQFAGQFPGWVPGILFVVVSSLPPLVAGRLIHFRSEVGNGRTASTLADAPAPLLAPAQEPISPHAPSDAPRTDETKDARNTPPIPAPPPHAPEAPAARTQTPAPAPKRTEERPAATVARLTTRSERARIIDGLIAEYGRDGVDGAKVGAALGIDRSNGYRALQKRLKELDTPTSDPGDPDADEADREDAA